MLAAGYTADTQRSKHSRIIAAVLIAVLTWFLATLDVLSPLEGFLYDRYLRVAVAIGRPQAHVVLVEVDRQAGMRGEESCLKLIRRLKDLGARHVLLDSVPENASEDFFHEIEGISGVILGRHLIQDPSDREAVMLSPVPREAHGRNLKFGVVHVLPSADGVHRKQGARVTVDGRVYPAIETLVLARNDKEKHLMKQGRYLVDYVGGAGSLPTVGLEMAASGRLIRELIEGKSVFVGEVGRERSEGLTTPTTKGGQTMSALEFHGHSLNTMLSNRVRRDLGLFASLFVLLLLAFSSNVLYQWTDVVLGTWITLAIIVITCLISYYCFVYEKIWLPLPEIVICQGALFVYSLRERALLSGAWLRRVLVSISSQLNEKHSPMRLDLKSECWPLIVNMIHQTLDLNRLIFLETVPGKNMIREIKALNCSIDDISDRRRDYQRAPYLTAMESGGPIRVENYLKKAFDKEEQYLIPLSFGGEALGFWACGVDRTKVASVPVFENVLRDYAALISEVIYQKRQASRSRSWLGRLEAGLTGDRNERTYEELRVALEILQGRLRQIEGLLSDIKTAAVVYDLFGRVLQINDSMLELLENENLNPQKMTALDLVAAVSDYDLAKSRRILRHVVIDQQVITVPVKLSGREDSRYVMHLHPLQVRSTEKGGDALQELSGKCILCELVDTTAFTGLFEMKEKLAARLGLQLRNDMASIDLSSALLGKEGLSADQREHISQIVHDKVARTMDVLVECQQYLSLDSQQENVERFPVDSQEAFKGAVLDVKSLCSNRNVEMEVDEPNLMSFVLASAENLRVIFATVLKLLLSDATDGSPIEVEVSEGEDVVTYRLRNKGFGIPNDRFQDYIFGDTTLASEELKTLREAVSWVEAWGGELHAASEVGVGTRATLRLVKFI